MLQHLYKKFTDHYGTEFYFGYATKDLYNKLSVQDRRNGKVKIEPVAKDSTEEEIKLQYWKMMKELGYAPKAS